MSFSERWKLKWLERDMENSDAVISLEQLKTSMDQVARRTMQMDWAWDWPAGVAFYGITRAWEALGEQEYLDYLISWVDRYLARGIPKLTVNAVSLGHTLITLSHATGKDRYQAAVEEMAQFLATRAVRFGEGVFQHTVSQNYDFPEQAWADTLFMAAYFLVRMGKTYDHAEYLADGLNQYYWHEEFLQDRKTDLYYHAWDNLKQNNMSSVFWARANGWAAVTAAEALSLIDVFNPSFMKLLDSLRDQLAALVRLQSDTGLWHTVLDDPDAYEEVSASAGILTGLIGYESVLGQNIYQEQILRGIRGLLSNVTAEGKVMNVSAGTAVMKNRADYCSIPCKRVQGWGQGLVLSALAKYYLMIESRSEK